MIDVAAFPVLRVAETLPIRPSKGTLNTGFKTSLNFLHRNFKLFTSSI